MRGRMGLLVLCGACALGCGNAPAATKESLRALTLLHTADIHSRVRPFRSRISRFESELGLGPALALDEIGGAARLATRLRAERAEAEQAGTALLWLDSGDALEGAEVFHRFGGEVEVELLSALGLGAMALGNHELSLGAEELARLFATAATFSLLSANVRPRAGSPLARLLVPSAVLNVGGVPVGVVGVANPGSPPSLPSPDNPWQLEVAGEQAAAVQEAVDSLTGRAALIVLLSHQGLEQDHALLSRTSGIDLVLGGHQHVLTSEPEWQDDCALEELQAERGCSPRRVPIVHSGAYLRWLSRLQLQLAPDPARPGALELEDVALTHLPLASAVPEDPEVLAFLGARRAPAEAPLAYLAEPITRRSALAGDSALGNLTVDAVRAASSADVVVLNSSGLRADLEAGPLLRSDLDLAFPFDDAWRLVWLDGQTLRHGLERAAWRSAARDCESALQVSGLRLTIHCAACSARSANCLEIDRPTPAGDLALGPDAWLLVALPNYLALDGGDFEAVGGTGVELAASVLDAVVRHLQSQPLAGDDEACQRGLLGLSQARCHEAFGELACPLTRAQALATCRSLPSVEGRRDGRVAVVP
ncbi:MAG TPA: 5'-nucleotidase C-terminal domain-containing protein [Polyangiaceae bacterium]|nr:5'-nucleotidase C-terminal domain-containing protein [Polyangiaceae bacterium]